MPEKVLERNYDFIAIAYEYRKEESRRKGKETTSYCQYNLEELRSNKQYERELTFLKQDANDLQKDFKMLVQIFNIASQAEDFMQGIRNVFDSEDKDFLIDVLWNFRKEKIWTKGIKKIDPNDRNRFLNKYKTWENPGAFAEELIHVVDGLIKMYRKLDVKEDKKNDFEMQLKIWTQYQTISWIEKTKKIVQNITPVPDEIADETISGIVYEDYCKWLDHLQNEISELIEKQISEFTETVKRRKSQYKGYLESADEETSKAIKTIEKRVEERKKREIGNRSTINSLTDIKDFNKEKEIWQEEIERFFKEDPEMAKKAFKAFAHPERISEDINM